MINVPIKGRCNIKCIYCNYKGSYPNIDIDDHFAEIKKTLDNIKDKKKKIVFGFYHFEPTTYPRFLDNGIKLADITYVKNLKKAGIKGISLSLFGYDNYSCSIVAQSDLNIFDQKKQAIHNCINMNIDLNINILLMTFNYYLLREIFNKYLQNISKIKRVDLYFLDLCLNKRNEVLIPTYSSIVPYVLKLCRENSSRKFCLFNVPFCVFDKIPPNLEIINEARNTDPEKMNEEAFTKIHIIKCFDCVYRSKCAGINLSYMKMFGLDEFLLNKKFENKYSLKQIQEIFKNVD